MTEAEFINELKKIKIVPTSLQLEQLKKYFQLLIDWNSRINLTAITELAQVYLKHFYDSSTLNMVVDLSSDLTVCDVGTGAGFPGIVLKILFPNLKITLIDALKKRIDFLNIVINELKLENIVTNHIRTEEYALKNRECFDIVTARAVAPLNILLEYCIPLVKVDGYFIPMKANISREILDSQRAFSELSAEIVEKIEYELPNNGGYRTLIKIKKSEKTKLKYPRRNAEIKKKPL